MARRPCSPSPRPRRRRPSRRADAGAIALLAPALRRRQLSDGRGRCRGGRARRPRGAPPRRVVPPRRGGDHRLPRPAIFDFYFHHKIACTFDATFQRKADAFTWPPLMTRLAPRSERGRRLPPRAQQDHRCFVPTPPGRVNVAPSFTFSRIPFRGAPAAAVRRGCGAWWEEGTSPPDGIEKNGDHDRERAAAPAPEEEEGARVSTSPAAPAVAPTMTM